MKKRKELIIEDAEILYPNFSGRESMYNREGDRNFNVVIRTSEFDPDAMIEDGWNVKIKTPKVNEGDSYYILPVAVGYHPEGSGLEFLNPKAYIITGNRKVELTESTIGRLDSVNSEHIDVIISAGEYTKRDGTHGIKAWLKEIYVVAESNRFAEKYADYD